MTDVSEVGELNIEGGLNVTGILENDGTILIDHGMTPGGAQLTVGVSLEGSGEVVLGDSDFANSGATLHGGAGPASPAPAATPFAAKGQSLSAGSTKD